MATEEKTEVVPRDVRHLRITSDKLRALLHNAWIHGNDCFEAHYDKTGEDIRYAYVDQVMIEKGYKRPS